MIMSALMPALMEIQTHICPGGATQADSSHWKFPVHGGLLKVKFTLEQTTKAQRGEQRYSSAPSLTSALDRGGWSTSRCGLFTPGKTRYPLYRRLDGPQGGKSRSTSFRSPDRLACSVQLYRLSYPGPHYNGRYNKIKSKGPFVYCHCLQSLFIVTVYNHTYSHCLQSLFIVTVYSHCLLSLFTVTVFLQCYNVQYKI